MKVSSILVTMIMIVSILFLIQVVAAVDGAACNTDDDCGASGYIGGEYCSVNDVYKDYKAVQCIDSVCHSNLQPTLINSCQYACTTGICILCDSNADCSDNNAYTSDMCNNAGTIESYCSHQAIDGRTHDIKIEDLRFWKVKFTELAYNRTVLVKDHAYDVAIDVRNIGNFTENVSLTGKILQGTDEFGSRNFESLINFPADEFRHDISTNVNFSFPVGYYNVSVMAQVINDSNLVNNVLTRQITIVNCIGNSDCHLGYTCQNSGMVSSQCVQITPVNITCSTNAQCGTNGYVGANSCMANNVTRNYVTYTCGNPGMNNSYCSNSTTIQVMQQCSDMCANGSCVNIACHNDNDCDDNRSNTDDSCINPGTVNSYCVNHGTNGNGGSSHGGGFCGDYICTTSEKTWCTEDCGVPFELTNRDVIRYVDTGDDYVNSSIIIDSPKEYGSTTEYATSYKQGLVFWIMVLLIILIVIFLIIILTLFLRR